MSGKIRHINIPVFIPHLGCPNACVFCNQRTISGTSDFREEDVRGIIDGALATVPRDSEVEIAFFGGSFTGIDRSLMLRLLDLADEYIDAGKVTALRCSTRPDYIDDEILSILTSHHMTTVELGIQSTDDAVLAASRRGHDSVTSERACRAVKAAGLELVGQMMTGLPGADVKSEIKTAEDICAFGADAARVYPAVVFRGTELECMSVRGEYTPLGYDEAAERTASVLDVFDRAGVPVIRVGLCAGEGLTSPDTVAGGANHPAMGELAMGELFYRRISEAIDEFIAKKNDEISGKDITVYVRRGALSCALGQKKRNITRLREKYCRYEGINRIFVLESCGLLGYNIKISINNYNN